MLAQYSPEGKNERNRKTPGKRGPENRKTGSETIIINRLRPQFYSILLMTNHWLSEQTEKGPPRGAELTYASK